MNSKVRINFDLDKEPVVAADRPPNGVEQEAYEYARHNINFDRNNKFSEIKRIMQYGNIFTETELNSDAFLKGIERAERTAKKENKTLRGTVDWTV